MRQKDDDMAKKLPRFVWVFRQNEGKDDEFLEIRDSEDGFCDMGDKFRVTTYLAHHE